MSTNEIGTIVGLFLTTGGLKVLLDYLRQRRQDSKAEPIETRDASIEAAEHILVVSRQTIDRLNTRVEKMEQRDEERQAELNDLRRRIGMVIMPYVEKLRKYIVDGGKPPPPDYPEGWWDFLTSTIKEDK